MKAPDLGANAVTGSDVAPNSITGSDVDESSLHLGKSYDLGAPTITSSQSFAVDVPRALVDNSVIQVLLQTATSSRCGS